MNPVQLGLIAGILTSCAVLPQIVKSYRSRHVRDISLWQPVMLVVGMGLWLLYGILIDDLPLIVTNIFSITCNLILLTMKLYYADNRMTSKATNENF